MTFDDARRAVVTVGDGRGFIVENADARLIVTAAHCLPHFPPCASPSFVSERTYVDLVGALGSRPSTWAECLFVDPISDLAVLGSPDNQALVKEAAKYAALADACTALTIVNAPPDGSGWALSLAGRWFQCRAQHYGAALWLDASEEIAGGMSGSPILNDRGAAIGVVCAAYASTGDAFTDSGPNPRLAHSLPGWMLRVV